MLLCLVLLLPLSTSFAAVPTRVAVIYPDVSAPYSQVFEKIIEGIERHPGITVVAHRLSNGDATQRADDWLSSQNATAIIALGQQSHKVARDLKPDIPVIVGATLIAPNGLSGVSLAADPEAFFSRLGSLTPPVRRVFTVYNRKQSGWLIERAAKLARKYDIELISKEAESSREAVLQYNAVLDMVRDGEDALWLPLDQVAPGKTILPSILKQAWQKRLVVFSSNPSHTRKGTLFALFPDHRGLGLRLAEIVVDSIRNPNRGPVLEPLKALKIAVNMRTASHLGVNYNSRLREQISLTFPLRR
ncbi:ABC transporter substrate binding protein [Candidatus Reidiella endopervernicosa]|uniref:ABC transporter substrate-binding protein n=1 Tax=Candidatus Reidiella endopervernicosa TaxID=2738883 RepID=A0A6N0I0E1_9GAMM|nr:ABC transporter substrate binding protein [Candidatus Reidiella endopervernicosa]QKQ28049.1 ABC transporter substrate-binding protein [Candidatus Reidiella endopervernicosa]